MFAKGTPINSFVKVLRNTIRALYGIQDSNIISDHAIKYLLSTLDESLRREAKIFQLTGIKTQENVSEFVNSKMGLQPFSHGVEYTVIEGHNSINDLLTILGNMTKNLLINSTSQNNRLFGSNFQKPGYSVGNCFTFRRYLNCNEKCHITKNCKKNSGVPATINLHENLTTEYMQPEQRNIIKVTVTDRHVSFLFDTRWLI